MRKALVDSGYIVKKTEKSYIHRLSVNFYKEDVPMEPKLLKNFQVIGRCAKMQTLSWDEMIKRVNGVPYRIDFYQDFPRYEQEKSCPMICSLL